MPQSRFRPIAAAKLLRLSCRVFTLARPKSEKLLLGRRLPLNTTMKARKRAVTGSILRAH